MAPIRRSLLVSLLVLAVGMPTASAQEALGDGRDELRITFLELLNREREKQGLPPVRLAAPLSRAAQAHADDMVGRKYYDLKAPDGRAIEDWLKEAGYREQLVTEKVFKTADPPPSLASSWGRSTASHRLSLFHPEVEELGVGIGQQDGVPLYTFVLARSEASYLSSYARRLFADQAARFQDLDALRQEMLALVNQARAARKRPPLTLDPALNRAAQAHAEEIFQSLQQGQPLPKAWTLSAKVREQDYPLRGSVGESVVQGALSPEATLASLLGREDGDPKVLGSGYTQLGLGLAFEPTADGFYVVWVQCLARRRPGAP